MKNIVLLSTKCVNIYYFPDWIPEVGGKKFGFDLKKSEHITIKRFETGGFIKDGLFTANKGEIIGKFNNGKSVVANNEQITEAFARSLTNSLAPAIYAAVKQAGIEVSKENGGGDVYLDGAKLTDGVVGHINIISQSRGRSPLWGMNN